MVKWLFFKPIKIFWSIVAQKNKTKAKEKVCRSNWKVSKNRGIFKHISHLMGSYSRDINVQNALEYSWRMGFVSCGMKVYPWKFSLWTCTKLRILFNLSQPTCSHNEAQLKVILEPILLQRQTGTWEAIQNVI